MGQVGQKYFSEGRLTIPLAIVFVKPAHEMWKDLPHTPEQQTAASAMAALHLAHHSMSLRYVRERDRLRTPRLMHE